MNSEYPDNTECMDAQDDLVLPSSHTVYILIFGHLGPNHADLYI